MENFPVDLSELNLAEAKLIGMNPDSSNCYDCDDGGSCDGDGE